MRNLLKSTLYSLLMALFICQQAVVAATYTVTNIGDNGGIDPPPGAGTGTLRQAIVDANFLTPGVLDMIVFNIGQGGQQTIQPLRQLPDLTDPAGVLIDGFTQPGGATSGANPPSTAVLLIEIDGSLCVVSPPANTAHGFVMRSPNNTIRGLVINRFREDGILIPVLPTGVFNNLVFCNFIGTDPTGQINRGNGWDQLQLWAGVYIGSLGNGTAFDNTVDANLISCNYTEGVGIMSCPTAVDVYQNHVTNNYIGTDINGMLPFGNIHDGVYIGEGAHHNLVDGNLISANGFEGVCIIGYPPYGWDSHSNTVSNNIIGLNIALMPLANMSDGVNIGIYGANQVPQFYQGGYSTRNTIGPNNTISQNGRNGVLVWEYPDGLNINADKNRIIQNQIFNNNFLGIDLGDDLVTANDLTDPDNGSNQELNFPIITGAVLFSGQTTISGTLDIDTNPVNAIVELFKLNTSDPSGFGEGDVFLTQVTPAAGGNWSITLPGMALGAFLSATTTDVNNNTSEFSSNIPVANTVNVTVTTNPPGLGYTVDGSTYASQQTFAWLPFTTHTLSTVTPQNATPNTRLSFNNWSDGGAISHTITTSLISTTYVANFNMQYLLAISVNPPGSGAIITSPAGPWFNAGNTVTLTAMPGPGFMFTVWSGNLSGNTNPATLVMNSANTVIANFAVAPVNVVSTIPSQNAVDVNKSSNIQITFDQAINPATLTNASFLVSGHLKGYYTGTFSYDSPSKTATFNPTNDFSDGEVMSVMLTTNIKSAAGASLNKYAFSFTTEASNPTKMTFIRNAYYADAKGYLTSADFNKDGWIDVAVYTRDYDNTQIKVAVLMNNQGTLQMPVNYIRPITQYLAPGRIYSFDVDRDNDIDIVLTEVNAAGGYLNIVVMKNNGNGTFATPLFYPAWSCNDLDFADFNNDGFIDIVGNMYGDMYKIGVFLNDGTGKFNTQTAYTAGYYPKTPFCADFNNDGYSDIAVLVINESNNTNLVSVIMNNGNGTFGSPLTYFVNLAQRQVLKGADFNGDGYIDLVCAGDLGYRVNVLLNNGNGTFGTQSEYLLPNTHWPKDLICTDIDGDTDIDIVTYNRESYGGNLSVHLNVGNGVFWYYLTTSAHPLPLGMMLFADFDNDGDIDPVLTNDFGQVSIYWNTGTPEFDFGDAPDPSYPTLLANNGARHVKSTYSFFLGSSVDSEPDGQPGSQATGDDVNGTSDDEDGVIFSPPLVPGTQDTVQVYCTNYLYPAKYGHLSAWIDFNRDGDWADANEKIISDYGVGNTAGTYLIPFSIPANAIEGATFARFRLSTLANLGYKCQAPDGEVEDYKIVIGKFDFGDAPDPTYPTLLASNGARHIYDGQTWLGACVDPEADGLPDANALGDDNSALDDEDGVIFTNTPAAGANATIQITASVAGKLNAWFDFNADGDWADTGEQIFTNTGLAAGVNNLSFAVPAEAIADTTFARFRFNTTGGLSYTGAANNGEVEDYKVVISPAGTTWNDGFDNYTLNSDIVGQGGWEFWGGATSSSFARITNAQAFSGSQSLKIRGVSAKDGEKSIADDIIHQYYGCNSGVWLLTAWQFIPNEASGGTTYLVLMNQYDHSGTTNNWSTQVKFDPDENTVESEFDNVTLPLIKGSWVKICVTIDLDNDLQTISYNGEHLITKSWTNGMYSAGILNIAAVDLFANTLANVDVYYDEISLRLLETQSLELWSGWSGLSSYVEPADPEVEVVFSPVGDNLVILYNISGVYWPGQNLNTLGEYDVYSGYVLKMNDDAYITLSGDKVTNRTVNLEAGWNLMPVLSESDFDIETLFTGISGFRIAKEVAGSGVYWAEYGINTIEYVHPGKAYFVNMDEAATIDFSLPPAKSTSGNLAEATLASPWNPVIYTPATHLVAFNIPVDSFMSGDIVGGFTPSCRCVGMVEVTITSAPFALCVFGDDILSENNDGFETGETINYAVYRPSTGETLPLAATYKPGLNTGNFEDNGLSEITSVNLLETSLNRPVISGIKIIPNPCQGIFSIEGIDARTMVNIYNSFGSLVFSNTMLPPVQINFGDKPAGVYFIRTETENGTFFGKLIKE